VRFCLNVDILQKNQIVFLNAVKSNFLELCSMFDFYFLKIEKVKFKQKKIQLPL
jgi:hypothetical protein